MELSIRQRRLVMFSVLTVMLLSALESTVVTTAMPTVVSKLGGINIYSWVFSAYLLTSTISMPIWGRLSDIYGRRNCFLVTVALFLLGSLLSGVAQTMPQLVIFRALQGIGAGGLLPLPLIIIGEIYTLEERAKMQIAFSSLWGGSSLAGPLVGGFIIDHFSWRWIFLLNLPVGIVASLLVIYSLPAKTDSTTAKQVDFKGAALLMLTLLLLLLGCFNLGEQGFNLINSVLLLSGLMGLIGFIQVERHAPMPILALSLFKNRTLVAGMLGNFFAGWAMFGIMSFMPLFMQIALGATATAAGKPLTVMLLSWVSCSFVMSRLILRWNYQQLVLAGMTLLCIGLLGLMLASHGLHLNYMYLSLSFIGLGMGSATFALLIAMQQAAAKEELGMVTAAMQFFRTIGSTIGTTVDGALLSQQLQHTLQALSVATLGAKTIAEIQAIAANPGALIEPIWRAQFSAVALQYFRGAIVSGIGSIFLLSCVVGGLAWLTAWFVPRHLSHQSAQSTAAAGD
jgi:EmrB/QacA subfamily drug resistance transporter